MRMMSRHSHAARALARLLKLSTVRTVRAGDVAPSARARQYKRASESEGKGGDMGTLGGHMARWAPVRDKYYDNVMYMCV